jgi:hypothetical protein
MKITIFRRSREGDRRGGATCRRSGDARRREEGRPLATPIDRKRPRAARAPDKSKPLTQEAWLVLRPETMRRCEIMSWARPFPTLRRGQQGIRDRIRPSCSWVAPTRCAQKLSPNTAARRRPRATRRTQRSSRWRPSTPWCDAESESVARRRCLHPRGRNLARPGPTPNDQRPVPRLRSAGAAQVCTRRSYQTARPSTRARMPFETNDEAPQ